MLDLYPLDVLGKRLVVVGIGPPNLEGTDVDILFSIRSKPRHDYDHGPEESGAQEYSAIRREDAE